LGAGLSAFDIMPFLLYPYLLLVSSLLFIFVIPEKNSEESAIPDPVDDNDAVIKD
jgi:hypothetical protein